mgnify:FL=1|tara:strand:- start:39 stop:257 length:219 start_codon:yes stop_codon:yes gene_type:complete
MKKQELKDLIDLEVSKVFSDMTSKEPTKEVATEVEESNVVASESKGKVPQKSMTEEDFDNILFYGGKNKKKH